MGYDLFPYTLWSEVDSFNTDKPNVVKVKGYGGASFNYKHICEFGMGEKIAARLSEIENNYKKEKRAMENKYREELIEFSKQYGVPMPKHVYK